MQVSFSTEKELIKKIGLSTKKFNLPRSFFITELWKWAVNSSPLIKEGRMFKAAPPSKMKMLRTI